MLKSLRKKFIVITMCSVTAVLTVIISIINIATFMNLNSVAEMRLNQIIMSRGEMPSAMPSIPFDEFMQPGGQPFFDTLSCFIFVDGQGNAYNVPDNALITDFSESARQYARELHNRGRTEGFYRSCKFRAFDADGGTYYVFLDFTREISTINMFFLSSVTVCTIGVLLIFLLVAILSDRVLKPVIEGYEKQKRFITDAGHEIKTPLTIIDAGAEIIEMENGASEWTKSIKNQVRRLSELTEKLVFLSRMEEDNKPLLTTDFSLSEAVKSAVESFEAVAETKNKVLTASITENVQINADKDAIVRLLSLLIDNALKYSDENGYINVSLSVTGKTREIKVTNSVNYIKKGRHDELFERFYRADSSRNSKTGGHGIGLSSAKAIVNAHKGRISAFSPDEKTIIFTVTL